jgi:hypothetical protein
MSVRAFSSGVCLALFAAAAAACSGSSSPVATAQGPSTPAATTSAPPIETEGGPPGAAVTVTTPMGFVYKMQALPPHAETQITNETGDTLDAPPGKVYDTMALMVTNPLTDRSESSGDYQLELAVPRADRAALGLTNATCSLPVGNVTDLPQRYCGLGTQVESLIPDDSLGDPQWAPGDTKTYTVALQDQVTEGGPIGDMVIFIVMQDKAPVLVPAAV